MPPINKYKCNKCDFTLPSGWGGYLFVENDEGERITCGHPGERFRIEDVLRGNFLIKLIKGRTIKKRVGFASDCLCLDCFHKFNADLADEKGKLNWRNFYMNKKILGMVGGKDKRECLKCKSKKVKTLSELINESCPQCHKGTIKEIKTGAIS